MRVLILSILAALWTTATSANTNNEVMKHCVQSTNNYNEAASCYFKWKNKQNEIELAELRDFLKHNPRYGVPGQSLNRCWGKPREMPFEKSTITVGPNGMEASVWYKDKLPAGCYENAPWDNRETK